MEVSTSEDAFILLQQWTVQDYFVARAGLDFLSAYRDLLRVREQRPEFLADINIGILWGDAGRASLWVQLVGIASSIARATLDLRGEDVVAHHSVLALV